MEKERDGQATSELASTGIEGLDALLGGGLRRNHLYWIEGPTGSGKTTLGLQFLLEGARRGEGGLFVTLAESRAELQAVAESHGWSLDGVTLLEFEGIDSDVEPDDQYTLFHPSEVELSHSLKDVFEEVERSRPARVVLDSVSELRLLARDPVVLRRKLLILRSFLLGRGCTALLMDEVGESSRDGLLRSLAHGLVSLQRLLASSGTEERRLRVVKMRATSFRSGHHGMRLDTGGLVVFPRLVAAAHDGGSEPRLLGTGVPGLDALVGGGFESGGSVALVGPAGSGKSSLILQSAFAAAQRGERTAVYLFEENVDTALSRASGLGLDLQRHVETGLVSIERVDSTDISADELAHRIRARVDEEDLRVLAIDSLSGYMHSVQGDAVADLHLHELLSFLHDRGVVTFLSLLQHGLLGPASTAQDLSYLADTVLLIRYFEDRGEVRKAISVIKKRSGPHEATIRELRFGSDGVRVGPPLREFEGILSGTPRYVGGTAPLLGGEGREGG